MWILQAKRGLAVYDVWLVTEAQYSLLKGRVRDIIDMSLDSVRFYILSKNENKRVEVIGVETAYKVEEALII